ncbi:MAG: pirin family protein [Pyrinomonadaceae bacterium]
MNKLKTIERILSPTETHWVGDGFRVHNFFPGGYRFDEQRMSPFYLLDYNAKIEFPPSDKPRGVGVHPHRGFETVTIAFKGKVAHHDSTGNSGVIGEGDIQWMTAGSGILHKEYHEREFTRAGGEFHMLQLWVNLPAKHKMTAPKYQAIENHQIAKLPLAGDKGTVEIIAGEYHGVKGTATTFSPIQMYNCRVKKGATLDFTLPENFNTGILILEGSVKINGAEIAPVDNFCLFNNDGTEIKVEALEDAMFIVLSGEPLNEPIAAYGPFVMNTFEEIHQAKRDFGSGKFGYLE